MAGHMKIFLVWAQVTKTSQIVYTTVILNTSSVTQTKKGQFLHCPSFFIVDAKLYSSHQKFTVGNKINTESFNHLLQKHRKYINKRMFLLSTIIDFSSTKA